MSNGGALLPWEMYRLKNRILDHHRLKPSNLTSGIPELHGGCWQPPPPEIWFPQEPINVSEKHLRFSSSLSSTAAYMESPKVSPLLPLCAVCDVSSSQGSQGWENSPSSGHYSTPHLQRPLKLMLKISTMTSHVPEGGAAWGRHGSGIRVPRFAFRYTSCVNVGTT